MRSKLALVVLTLCALLALPGLASAATINVAADFAAIQAAINGANPGDTVQVAAGTATLGPADIITIPASKLGLRLVGAGVGQTILQKSSAASYYDHPILRVGPAAAPSYPAPASTVVEGFTFKNSGDPAPPLTPTSAAVAAPIAIDIQASGASAADPGVVRNCEFLYFNEVGIVITEAGSGGHRYWDFSNNSFESKIGIWPNAADFISIRDNVFRNYSVPVGVDNTDVVINLTITGNDFLGGGYVPNVSRYRGIQLSAAADEADQVRNWNISNNYITDSTYGIAIQAAPNGVESLTGVVIQNNYIFGNTRTGTVPQTPAYADLWNASTKPLVATNNWWGQASGPASGQIVGLITTEPYLTALSEDRPAGAVGFWPASVAPPVVSTPASSMWSLVLAALAALTGLWFARRRESLAG